jgi:hypothetical protein
LVTGSHSSHCIALAGGLGFGVRVTSHVPASARTQVPSSPAFPTTVSLSGLITFNIFTILASIQLQPRSFTLFHHLPHYSTAHQLSLESHCPVPTETLTAPLQVQKTHRRWRCSLRSHIISARRFLAFRTYLCSPKERAHPQAAEKAESLNFRPKVSQTMRTSALPDAGPAFTRPQ